MSPLQRSIHSKFAMLSAAWVLCTFIWTTSALNITKPLPGDTIDISFPYNVTWTWDEKDPPLIRMQITPTFEESTAIITAAGIATFWAGGSVVSAQDMVAASPVEVQLVNPDQYTNIYAFAGAINLVNSANISAAPSTYSTTIYPGLPLASSSLSSASTVQSAAVSTSPSASAATSTSPSASASQIATISAGAVAGIVIGALIFVVLAAACVFFNRRRLHGKKVHGNKNDRDFHTGGQWLTAELPHENQVYEMHDPKNGFRSAPHELDS